MTPQEALSLADELREWSLLVGQPPTLEDWAEAQLRQRPLVEFLSQKFPDHPKVRQLSRGILSAEQCFYEIFHEFCNGERS